MPIVPIPINNEVVGDDKEDIGDGIVLKDTVGRIVAKSNPIAAEVVAPGVVDIVLLIKLIIEVICEDVPELPDGCPTASVGI